VPSGKLEVDGGVGKVTMTGQQDLDAAEIGASFQHVRRETASRRVRCAGSNQGEVHRRLRLEPRLFQETGGDFSISSEIGGKCGSSESRSLNKKLPTFIDSGV
jgi:hypothetical protein